MKLECKVLRQEFANHACLYIKAYCYHLAIDRVQYESSSRMYSTETIGWTSSLHPISQDMTFKVLSNFGFGNSSYMYLILTYKGITLVPYSEVVKYYGVNVRELMAYTRSYRPERKNWDSALSFVADVANKAMDDERKFAEEWIGNELEEMMNGLRRILEDPLSVLVPYMNSGLPQQPLMSVRGMMGDERADYKVYNSEFLLAFKCEKLACALSLLQTIANQLPIFAQAERYISELKDLGQEQLPQLRESLESVKQEIERRRAIVYSLQAQKEEISASLKSLREELTNKQDAVTGDTESETISQARTRIGTEFRQTHPEIAELEKKERELNSDIGKKCSDLQGRERFAARISNSINQITERLAEAA
ncbi:MAG: hypothetical protein LIP02_03080 [Bacteroidales bacterium]|nr:hypothetical protein [Bacteroidales bacterium]